MRIEKSESERMQMRRTLKIGILLFVAIVLAIMLYQENEPTQVNGVCTAETITFELTDPIYTYRVSFHTHYFYFHGFHWASRIGVNYDIMIGHFYAWYADAGGMTTIYVRAEEGVTFKLIDAQFRVVSYDLKRNTLTLVKIK